MEEKEVSFKIDKKYYFWGGVIVVILIVMYILGAVIIPKSLLNLLKPTTSNKISSYNSYLLGGKLLAKADGEDFCKVDMFLRDKGNKSISKRNVILQGVEMIEPKGGNYSDNQGRVEFKIKSKIEGQFKLKAIVDGADLGKEIVVTFRN